MAKALRAFGHRVRLVREARRESTQAVAARMGYTRSVVEKIERGTYNPSARVQLALAHALPVPLHVLWGSAEAVERLVHLTPTTVGILQCLEQLPPERQTLVLAVCQALTAEAGPAQPPDPSTGSAPAR